MAGQKRSLGLPVVMAVLVLSLPFLAQNAQKVDTETNYYHGTIGKTFEIEMTLTVRGSEIDGSYKYADQPKPIRVQGKVLQSVYFNLKEFDTVKRSIATFQLNGLLGPRHLEGTWKSGKKNLPVVLGQITAAQLIHLQRIWSGSKQAKDLLTFDDYACVLRSTGALCWGAVEGSPSLATAGPGAIAYRALPNLNIGENPTAASLTLIHSSGKSNENQEMNTHSCEIKTGAVYCMGENLYGQLGEATVQRSAIPHEVHLPEAAVRVATAADYSCALGVSGHVWCWGDNEFGQTGNESRDFCTVPNGKAEDMHVPCNKRPVAVRGL